MRSMQQQSERVEQRQPIQPAVTLSLPRTAGTYYSRFKTLGAYRVLCEAYSNMAGWRLACGEWGEGPPPPAIGPRT